MRLQTYIQESNTDDLNKLIPVLKKECKPYLKECKKYDDFLYRSSKKDYDIRKLKPRVDRKPRDTPLPLHNYMDSIFKKKFGWNARSESIFATSDYMFIEEYQGNPYIFFPIGNFKFLWHPEISDIFIIFRDHDIIDGNDKLIGDVSDHEDTIKEFINGYKSDNLFSAMKSGNEIMIKCKEYYMVRSVYFNQLKEGLLYD